MWGPAESRPLCGPGSIPGMPAPHSAAKPLAMQTLRASAQWFPPAWPAGQTPPPPPPHPHCLALWGTRLSPFLQGRKGLLGGAGMLGEDEWACK